MLTISRSEQGKKQLLPLSRLEDFYRGFGVRGSALLKIPKSKKNKRKKKQSIQMHYIVPDYFFLDDIVCASPSEFAHLFINGCAADVIMFAKKRLFPPQFIVWLICSVYCGILLIFHL